MSSVELGGAGRESAEVHTKELLKFQSLGNVVLVGLKMENRGGLKMENRGGWLFDVEKCHVSQLD